MKIQIHREMFRIAMCLLLGVVTTVAVAWGLAAFVGYTSPSYPKFSRSDTPGLGDFVTEWRAFGSVLLVSEFGGGWTPDGPVAGNPPSSLKRRFLNDHRTVEMVEGRGWPGLGLSWEMQYDWPPEAQRSRSRIIYGWDAGGGPRALTIGYVGETEERYSERIIPLRPILPGFIIDTLFYAVIWFGLFFGPGAIRRVLRRKRGCCEMCGYDLRGTPDDVGGPGGGCPECGWNREEALNEPRP